MLHNEKLPDLHKTPCGLWINEGKTQYVKLRLVRCKQEMHINVDGKTSLKEVTWKTEKMGV